MRDLRDYFRDQLVQALETVPAELRPSGQLLHGKAAAALAEEARNGVDLLCVGSRSHGPLRRVLLGSVSHELAGLVSRPMLVVPRGAVDEPTRGQPLTEVDSA
jgi:nucleotide-binding universal stress UspA family protein